MKRAYVFPGQGSQFVGMGKDLYEKNPDAKQMFEKANKILGFSITDIMFNGTDEDLKQTKVTQPSVFLHSVILAKCLDKNFVPDMVAGHSLGEISALVSSGAISFEDGLILVAKRAGAMQKACEAVPSTMAAILGLEDRIVEDICKEIKNEIVVCANYNSPGQIVISGTINGVQLACQKAKENGAKRALPLNVGGAFHSPLMLPAQEELEKAIKETSFYEPICPIYQNVNALPIKNPNQIKENLIKQLTSPVLWTKISENMINDGATTFIEVGPGNVLQGLVKKVKADLEFLSAEKDF
ncbi:MAG: ACP S-malonyltransferase [Bacteroidales bacterium]|jgi:[acyl-carrier-protein] S-malonyltransferase|nr:ACP S-malonyltransferase [Bacteroidales bacterium]